MRKLQLGRGFWIQTVLSAVTLVAAAVTALWPDWIELVFGADPDAGSGAVEWALVGGLLIASLTLAAFARRGWLRSAQTAPGV
ncbi:MAG: hypothetical protein WBX27_03050 [Specibacter sp.]